MAGFGIIGNNQHLRVVVLNKHGSFPLAFMPHVPPSIKKVDFFGILDNTGPNILHLGTARGKTN